ncbi:MAG: hypothetical protein AB7O31_15905 [Burkholderiales bacterium]
MPDISAIAAVLGSLKTATEIAKFIRESDVSIERAELKLKVADLIGALADVKLELVELQESFASKDQRIRELEEAFESKDALVRRYDAYYRADAAGDPTGAPYCLRCWESDHKQRLLVHDAKEYRTRLCTSCGHRYEGRLSGDIYPAKPEASGDAA